MLATDRSRRRLGNRLKVGQAGGLLCAERLDAWQSRHDLPCSTRAEMPAAPASLAVRALVL